MCSRPITKDGHTFACRSCNDCIATRRHNWVARAMMETACHPFGLVVALTYDDETQANRDAARMFAYVDVRAFVQRLTAAVRRVDKSHYVRFICAGEQGSRSDRCHWHLILWSSYDLRRLGEVSRFGRPVRDLASCMTVGKRKVRLHWSLWADGGRPKGFVSWQALNEASASYVLSYCLKDQFTQEKSRGTMREHKAEDFATGLFRMSKRPAIGEAWLMRKLERLAESGAVLPSLNLSIPGLSGYYQPSGSFRERLLWGLSALNTLARFRTGQDAPQWGGLLRSCQDNISDLGVLLGEETETYCDARNMGATAAEIDFRRRWRADELRRGLAARLRGWSVLCQDCLRQADKRRGLPRGGWSYDESSDLWRWQGRDGEGRSLHGLAIESRFGSGVRCPCCGTDERLVAVPWTDRHSTDHLQDKARVLAG